MTNPESDPRTELLRRAMSRRGFLNAIGATGAAAALAACGTGGSDNTEAEPGAGGGDGDSDTIVWANWTLYLDQNNKGTSYPTLEAFEQQSGYTVEYKEDINDNQSFNGKVEPQLRNGQDVGYDLVTITDWLVGQWIRKGYAARLDYDNIPNSSNLLPKFEDVPFDPGREYSLPWQGGFAGLAWDKEKVPGGLKTIDDLWQPALNGKVVVLSEMRDTVGLIMMSQGVRIDEPFTQEQFQAALDVLSAQIDSGQVKQVRGNDYKEDLISGQAWAAIGWSGDIFQINAENGNKWDFALPETGGALWSDNLVIPSTSGNKAGAEELINYYYDPKVAAEVAAWVNYICPVAGAQQEMEKIDPELASSPWIFPSDELLDNSQVFVALTPEEEVEYNDAFGRVVQG